MDRDGQRLEPAQDPRAELSELARLAPEPAGSGSGPPHRHHLWKGDIPKARQTYERALAMNPRLVVAANNLAWIYSEHGGDPEKALQLAQTAKQEAPEDPRVSDTLGWILYKRGVYQRALALLKDSASKLPDNPQVQYHLGMGPKDASGGDQFPPGVSR